jgi:hypothetical protein
VWRFGIAEQGRLFQQQGKEALAPDIGKHRDPRFAASFLL